MSEYIFEIEGVLCNEETGEICAHPQYKGELVRCKDCKYFETTFLTEGAGYFYNPCPRMIDRTENDYCSRAERKEE